MARFRKFLGPVFHELAGQRRSQILEGHIPPRYSVAEVIGYIKGKSAIAVARQFGGQQRNFNGEQFWARAMHFQWLGLKRNKFGATSESA
jgi:putative transposase